MLSDDITSGQGRVDSRNGEPEARAAASLVPLESARQRWAEAVRRLAPDLWSTVLAQGFAPAEATVVCRLAWLSLAQDWHPCRTSDDDVRSVFASVIERQRCLAEARALQGTSEVSPEGTALLVAL